MVREPSLRYINMDNIYSPGASCSSLFNLSKEFENAFDTLYPPRQPSNNSDDRLQMDIKNLMDLSISDSDFANIEESCSPKHLNAAHDGLFYGDPRKAFDKHPLPPLDEQEAKIKKTLSKLKDRSKNDNNDQFRSHLKYKNEMLSPPQKCINKELDLIPGKELLITVRMYYPFVYKGSGNRERFPKFHQSIVVLGSQKLSVLKDYLPCINDVNLSYDLSKNPAIDVDIMPKDFFKSGFVFIENTFYNDLRDPGNIDYSKVILDWAVTRDYCGPFQTAGIEDRRFDELSIRLGYPQVIQHQGICEHLFVFSNVRLLHETDHCHSSYYPHIYSVSKLKGKSCSMCVELPAKYVVTGSMRIPFDPGYFCESCFVSFNYKDGQKVGDFQAYKYQGMENILHTMSNGVSACQGRSFRHPFC